MKTAQKKSLDLFAGSGGGVLGGLLLGWRSIGYVEINEYCQQVITQRIKDGILDTAPIFSDIKAFLSEGYADEYKGMVDVLTAGFPCQPYSQSGKRNGGHDERNMWPETKECIRRVQPKGCLLENVSGLLSPFRDGRPAYFGTILRDLAECGYNAKWLVLGGSISGACNERARVWIVATNTNFKWLESLDISQYQTVDPEESFRWQRSRAIRASVSQDDYTRIKRDPDAVARGMERLKAIGNGQIPPVAAAAWEILK